MTYPCKFGLVLLITISLSELTLRLIGFTPGVFKKYNDFTIVDSLYTHENYVTDESGIYKFSFWVTDTLHSHFKNTPAFSRKDMAEIGINPMDGIYKIYNSFIEIQSIAENKKKSLNSEFAQAVLPLLDRKNRQSQRVKLLKTYLYHPFNQEGFRSIPFETIIDQSIKILLIGDSFVYGMSAEPYYNSFSDILLSRGYLIFNTGINGTDPAQYAAITEKYVPALKPDLVILNFYPGNDLMAFPRTPKKEEPHEHMTNAGFFESNPEGKYLNPKETYEYYLSLAQIPNTKESTFNFICSKSAILSILWRQFQEWNWVEHPQLNNYNKLRWGKTETQRAHITAPYLECIREICAEHNIPLLNVIVPERDKLKYPKNWKSGVDSSVLNSVFSGQTYYHPENLNVNDYKTGGDFHFNNSGALKYANFLDTLIQMKYIQSEK